MPNKWFCRLCVHFQYFPQLKHNQEYVTRRKFKISMTFCWVPISRFFPKHFETFLKNLKRFWIENLDGFRAWPIIIRFTLTFNRGATKWHIFNPKWTISVKLCNKWISKGVGPRKSIAFSLLFERVAFFRHSFQVWMLWKKWRSYVSKFSFWSRTRCIRSKIAILSPSMRTSWKKLANFNRP